MINNNEAFEITRTELKSGKYEYIISCKGYASLIVKTSKIRNYFVCVLAKKEKIVGKMSNNETQKSALNSYNKWNNNRLVKKEYKNIYLIEYKQ